MSDYRRAWHPGGTWFFTVNLLQRQGNDLLVRHIDVLRHAVEITRKSHPFIIHAWVVLPEHLHCVIELPPEDTDFALRWRLIKLILRVRCRMSNGAMRREYAGASGQFGNAGIGNI